MVKYVHLDDDLAMRIAGAWHYDHDFDLIAEITGQPTDWILPAGAVS